MNKLFKHRTFQIIIGVIGIILTGILMTKGLKNCMDIFFLDESSYLVRGTKMFGKISKRWGPLYASWYRGLFVFEKNLIDLFYLNFKLMAIIPATLLFLTLSRYFKSILLTFFIAACFLVSNYNLPIYPKISFFCSSGILLALYLSSYFKDTFNKTFIFLATALFLSFARNEFYLSFLLILGVLVVLIATKKIQLKKQFIIPVIAFSILALGLHLALGNPLLMKMEGYNRSLVAFGEHFAYNYSQWNNLDLYTWLAWENLFIENFGQPSSLTAAMKANFPIFWKHVSSNILGFTNEIAGLLTSLIIPIKLNHNLNLIMGIGLLALILFRWITNLKKWLSIEILFLVLLAIPTLISCILIYPRNHYLVLLVPITAFLLLKSLEFVKLKSSYQFGGMVVLIGLFLFIGPKAKDFKYFEIRKEEGVLNNQLAIALFQNSALEEAVTMLSNEGDFNEYTSKQIKWIVPNHKKERAFFDFLEEKDPEVIYITQSIHKNPYYANDGDWQEFLDTFKAYNYQKKTLGDGINEFFLIKTDLANLFIN